MGGIESRAVRSILPGGGAVGIADIQHLVQATLRPSAKSTTPYYWRAQEFGSSHNVGRVLLGVFQPGEAAPSEEQFRTHPAFESRPTGQKRFLMRIHRPIPERAFLREGAWEAYLYRKTRFQATEAAAIEKMRQIASASGSQRR